MMKQILIFISLVILTTSATAQEKGHYLSFDLGGGIQSIQYEPTNGQQSLNYGGTFNVGYHYFFSEHWGIATGLGVSSLRSKSVFSFTDSQNSYDDLMAVNYEHRTYYDNWTEYQTAILLDVPVAVNYQTLLGKKWKLLWAVGAKMHTPIDDKYKVTDGSYETRGYYPLTNVEYFNLPQHGFTTTQSDNQSGDLSLNKFSTSLFTDLGVSYRLTGRTEMYMGVYFSYGITDIADGSDKNLYDAQSDYCGTLASNQIDAAKAMSFGIKVGMNFHFKQKAKEEEPESEPELQPEPEPQPEVQPETEPESKPEPQPETKAKESIDVESTVKRINSNVGFNMSESQPLMDESTKLTLQQLAQQMKEDTTLHICITGHTCNIDVDSVNIVIGQRRADSIKQLLVNYGAPASAITTRSKGESEPIASNKTEEERKKNRRVELTIIEN